MKKLLILLLLVGCKKQTSTGPQAQPSVVFTQPGSNMPAPTNLMDSIWYPLSSGPIEIAFGSDGTYYEDEINSASIQGTWKVRAPDSLIVTKQFWYVQYRITKCTADTLRLLGVGNSVTTYTR